MSCVLIVWCPTKALKATLMRVATRPARVCTRYWVRRLCSRHLGQPATIPRASPTATLPRVHRLRLLCFTCIVYGYVTPQRSYGWPPGPHEYGQGTGHASRLLLHVFRLRLLCAATLVRVATRLAWVWTRYWVRQLCSWHLDQLATTPRASSSATLLRRDAMPCCFGGTSRGRRGTAGAYPLWTWGAWGPLKEMEGALVSSVPCY